ncbi:MAG: hypothetical protein RL618_2573 [Pseudomonadota bacterium]
MRIALITNTPPPYRVPVFTRLSRMTGLEFHAIFCARREPNRAWDLPEMAFTHHFLRERFYTVGDRYVHDNPDVIPLLIRLKPDLVITDGFNPTHLYAFIAARVHRWAHIAMTDGTLLSEQSLSFKHRLVRRMVFRRSQAFIAASEGGQNLFRSYDVNPEACFYSWLCVDNRCFLPASSRSRPNYDFIFCGRFEPAKDPLFALAVARDTARRLRRKTRMLFVGAGSLDSVLRARAEREHPFVDTHFHGFARQAELPGLYQSASIFLFPTHGDVWGVVANEACAAGLPVIVSPEAGVAGELVMNDVNGFVRQRDVALWVDCAQQLLSDHGLRHEFSERSLHRIARYEFDSAAQGIVDACKFALRTSNLPGTSNPSKTRDSSDSANLPKSCLLSNTATEKSR